MERAKRKKLGGRILGVILSLVLVLGLMPEIPGGERVVHAAGSEPGAAVYATKDQLMKLGPASDNTTIGRLVFGKNSSGKPLEWYILGKDTGVSGDNIAIFTTSPICEASVYYPREDKSSYKGGDATYANGFVPEWDKINGNHYCLSKVYKALQDMATNASYFAAGEQSLMQKTTVTTLDSANDVNYTTTDALYLLNRKADITVEKIFAGSQDNITVPWGIYWNSGADFWLRSPYLDPANDNADMCAGVAEISNGRTNSGCHIMKYEVEVRPASNINLTNVLFASAATAASSDVATGIIPADTAMVLRLDGSDRNMGTAGYSMGNIVVKRGSATGTVSLVVQGNDGTNDWYYSKVIGENTILSETDIESALASSNITDVNLSDCKIWLETTGADGLCYAVNVEERTIVSVLEVTDLAAPVAGVTLDDKAACATAGVLDTTPSVTWKADGNEATGTAKSGIVYTASVALRLPGDFMWENTATATVNGKNATSITENNDNTVTITYEFPAAGKDRLVSITEPQSISVANGTAYGAMNLPDTVSIVTEGNTVSTANVVWNTENPISGSYDPAISQEQTVTLSGTVTCPESIDANGVELTTSITITISAIYQIANAKELYEFAAYVKAGHKDVDAELTADIDFSGWDFSSKPWTPICQTKSFHASATADTGYSGTFDGNGYTVSNLKVNGISGDTYSYGLFGTVSGTIKNLGMVNFTYTMGSAGDTRAGSVAGQLLTGGTITNCYSVGHSIKTNSNIAGGIAGCNYGGTISNCYAISPEINGSVTGHQDRWGGVVGDCQKDDGTLGGIVSNCYTNDTRVVSSQSGNATITNCGVKAATAFTSGEVAYLLNGSTNGGTTWYQNLDESADAYPVLDGTHGKVYVGYDVCKLVCANSDTGLSAEAVEHSWTDGKCTVCEKECSHSWTDSKCTVCEKECSHSWTDGKCTVCEKECSHSWTDGKCTVCEKECSHSWNGNICTICNVKYIIDITVARTDGIAFEKGEYTFDYNTKVHTINTTKEVMISGTTKREKIVVAKDVSAKIIFKGVSIDVSAIGDACAFKIVDKSTGNVTITLADDTENKLKSGSKCAGLQKNGNYISETQGKLTIQGGIKGTGTLEASGNSGGAGIGGGQGYQASNITINGGKVTATGSDGGAGIGGGDWGEGSYITINGGKVTATGSAGFGGTGGAGIGGGFNRAGSNITISGGTVTATGAWNGAGIGGGSKGAGSNIAISGGTVTATGGHQGAGIGGGYYAIGSNIIINGDSVKATAGKYANAIGGGSGKDAITPTLEDKTTPVYLLEIANENKLDIVINDTDYPDKHFDENKIYAYLPAGTAENPYIVKIGGNTVGVYYYDSGWKTVTCANGHKESEDDGNCTTAITCSECGYVIKAGADAHTWVNGKCTNTNCDVVCTEHIPNEDDGDCTTAITCSVCGEVAIEAEAEHIDSNNDGWCDVCDSGVAPKLVDGYYQIANAGNLLWFAEFVSNGEKDAKDANAVLLDNINMTGVAWTPICQTVSFHETVATDTGYRGTFDGNGHTISNLTVTFNPDTSKTYSHGLFGTVSGTVKNLGMVDFKYENTEGDTRAGSVAGQVLTGGTITNCYSVRHSIATNNNIAGGIAGCTYGGTISNCYALNGSVSGYGTRWGGVVGDCKKDDKAPDLAQTYGTVSNCYTDDTRVASTQNNSANITNCAVENDAAFASGEITYLLNGSSSENVTWYQTLKTDEYPVLDSEHSMVYSVFKCDGTTPAGYSNENKNKSHADENKDGYCDVCGTKMDGITATLAGHSVSLGGQIGMNFYMDLDDSVLGDDKAYMLFTLPNGSKQIVKVVDASSETINEKTYYVFTCEVAAKEMAGTIKAKIVCGDGSEGTEYAYSVREYAEALMKNTNATLKQKALAKAMLNYGAYAQKYFAPNVAAGELANVTYPYTEGEFTVTTSDLKAYVPTVSDKSEILDYVGSTLILEADIKVRHYFKLEDGKEYNGALTQYTAQQEGTYYYYESDGITAANLGAMDNYTGVTGISISYCPLSYVTTVLANKNQELTGDKALQNLMKALYLYYDAVADRN